jgi:type I restriction enzyme, S subunit
VIGDLKPYADYKDSGLPWLGQVPAHWRVVRNGSLFGQRSQTGYAELPILEVSLKTGVQVRSFGGAKRKQVMSDFGKYKRAAKGDLAYNTMRMWQGALGICPVDGLVSPAYVVARPYPEVVPQYFAALFRTGGYMAEIDAASRGIVKDRNRLYWDQFKQMQSPCPPPDEQAAIVGFLAWANGRLDSAIRAKRKVIALLTEQKHAIVHRTVTRGLDLTAPSKPSGVPWIDQIPRHWHVMPIKRTCSLVRDGTHLPPVRTTSGFPLLSVRNMINGRLVRRPDDSFISKADFDQLNSSFVVLPGDVLLAIVGATLGKVAIVDDIGPFQIQRSVAVLRPRAELMTNSFLETFLRSPRLQEHLWRSVAFSAQPGIYLGFVANIPVPVPPTIKEQLAICEAIQRELGPVDAAISRLTAEINLIREYGTRLVSELVTGKVDVRDAAARLPDEVALNVAEDLAKTTGDAELADEEEAA